ncbi:hypothetical protein ACF3NT_00060 [Naumannella halotolerans]|uniref:hypothetical protein n=1 Tax=Naumannella halotolerans TaxID=993414 RepID=UPI00370D7802
MVRGNGTRRWASLLIALLTLLIGPAGFAVAADDVAFTVDDEAIAAPTGFAYDVETDRYWMARSSGAGEVVGLNSDGEVEGVVGFGAETQQVQALADDADRLFVGDIGDVDLNREFVTVYFLTNAEPGTGDGTYGAFDLAYPDGPHDAKAMFVRSGRVYLVTAGDDPAIYAAPEQPDRTGVNQLERLGDAPANVTDATVLGDGRVVLRTYTSLHVLDGDGVEVGSSELPWQQAGETIARDAEDDSQVLIGDSAQPIQVLRTAIPDEVIPVAEAPASPGAEPAEDTSGETEVAEPSSGGAARTGTFVAIGLAALVAVLAAVIAFRAKSPAGADLRPRVTFSEPPGSAVWRAGREDEESSEQADRVAESPEEAESSEVDAEGSAGRAGAAESDASGERGRETAGFAGAVGEADVGDERAAESGSPAEDLGERGGSKEDVGAAAEEVTGAAGQGSTAGELATSTAAEEANGAGNRADPALTNPSAVRTADATDGAAEAATTRSPWQRLHPPAEAPDVSGAGAAGAGAAGAGAAGAGAEGTGASGQESGAGEQSDEVAPAPTPRRAVRRTTFTETDLDDDDDDLGPAPWERQPVDDAAGEPSRPRRGFPFTD